MTDPTELLRGVLADALARSQPDRMGRADLPDARSRDWAIGMRNAWIASLRQAFGRAYRDCPKPGQIVCFGGKPAPAGAPEEMPARGVVGWSRGEFLFDVSVVRTIQIDAPRGIDPRNDGRPSQISLVTEAIWLVESELSNNSRAVAEDASKLQVARSENLLLVAKRVNTSLESDWLAFLGRAMKGAAGNGYVALMPTYSSHRADSLDWWHHRAEIALYRCDTQAGTLTALGQIAAALRS